MRYGRRLFGFLGCLCVAWVVHAAAPGGTVVPPVSSPPSGSAAPPLVLPQEAGSTPSPWPLILLAGILFLLVLVIRLLRLRRR